VKKDIELRLISFGPFVADLQTQELRKHGIRLHVAGQSFQILRMLLERPGGLVTRDDLRQSLWPSDTFVDFEHSLNTGVSRLREVLGDDANHPRYIETLPRRGYRFIAPVEKRLEVKKAASRRRFGIVLAAGILVLAATAAGFWWHKLHEKGISTKPSPSIAVLPFADLSPNHDQEYFADGLAEEILDDLTASPNLRVVARTSAFQFKGKNEDLRAIGQKLNVDNILEGSVRIEGTHVRISAQLVKAADGFHLWAQSYDRDLNGVLNVQDEIAQAIASALQVNLLPEDSSKSPRAPQAQTTNPEAYQDYLEARYFASMTNKESMLKALEYADNAIQADPHYAPAYAWRSYIRQTQWEIVGPDDPQATEKARQDAEKAIELDPNLADGYRVLSWLQAWYELNCPEADKTLRRAMELAPGDAWNLETKGMFAMCMGHQGQAVELLEQGIVRDPLPVLPHLHLALNLRDLGRYEEAHAELKEALDLDPHAVWIHETQGEVYLAEGQAMEALTEMEKEPGFPYHELGLALANHALGRDQISDAALAVLLSKGADCCAYQIGEVYAYRRNANQAFGWLNRAYKQHDGGLGSLKTDLLLNPLRADPRYADLLRRMNLTQ
jgi:TolB-like protein/DNA-binding winged helix-turn-helix (wHTH) protein